VNSHVTTVRPAGPRMTSAWWPAATAGRRF